MYTLKFTVQFHRIFDKLIRKDTALKKRIAKSLELLRQDPKHPSLKSHKVQTKTHGQRWSSRVTGDIRLIWDFDDDDNLFLIFLDLGGHSGKKKIYK